MPAPFLILAHQSELFSVSTLKKKTGLIKRALGELEGTKTSLLLHTQYSDKKSDVTVSHNGEEKRVTELVFLAAIKLSGSHSLTLATPSNIFMSEGYFKMKQNA